MECVITGVMSEDKIYYIELCGGPVDQEPIYFCDSFTDPVEHIWCVESCLSKLSSAPLDNQ